MSRRRLALAALTTGSLLAVTPGVAAARTHPAYTDPAGDAANPAGLLHEQIPAADLLSADVTADSQNLIFTTQVLGPHRYLANGVNTYSRVNTQGVSVSSETSDISTSVAYLTVEYADSVNGYAPIVVQGTASVDPVTHTTTATYSLDQVNAAEQLKAEEEGLGALPAVFSPSTVIDGADALTELNNGTQAVDRAGAIYPEVPFTLGG